MKPESGVLETLAARTWITHRPIEGWGTGHTHLVLNNQQTWLLGTRSRLWRTADSGTTCNGPTESMVHVVASCTSRRPAALHNLVLGVRETRMARRTG